ncbi:MAG: WXG100 family type VII secretion target [Jatrophihabitans sp.]|uniref:WXG100 family type VII secretion target n=1 Tax=Jatrophihabitans sp. TaxID=1932789 RepID=UPI003F7E1007
MAQYTTNQEAMAQGAVKVEDAQTQIQGHIQTLRSEVETMMGGWRGEAANAFVQVHDAFEQQANKIVTALGQMHESLVATQRTYGTNESDQSSSLTGLAGQING